MLKENAQAYSGELMASVTLAMIFIIMIIFFVLCLIIFRHNRTLSHFINRGQKGVSQDQNYIQERNKKDTIIVANLVLKDETGTKVKLVENSVNEINKENSVDSFLEWGGSRKCLQNLVLNQHNMNDQKMNQTDDNNINESNNNQQQDNLNTSNLKTNQIAKIPENQAYMCKGPSQQMNGIVPSLRSNDLNQTNQKFWKFRRSENEPSCMYDQETYLGQNLRSNNYNTFDSSQCSRMLPKINHRRYTDSELDQIVLINRKINNLNVHFRSQEKFNNYNIYPITEELTDLNDPFSIF